MARRLIAVSDPDGRSRALDGAPPPPTFSNQQVRHGADGATGSIDRLALAHEPQPGPGEVRVTRLWSTHAVPPVPAPCEAADPDRFRIEGVPGGTQFLLTRFGPHVATPMHRTATIDYQFIVDGQTVLVLDDGEHPLGAGDSVVLQAVHHAWRTGALGCTRVTVLLGIDAAAASCT
ncbi:MAG: hypothetical protein AB7Q97_20915 [Gammaproteobacteria bacterium]